MIELPLPPKVLSPNVTGAHWGTKKRAIKRYRQTCWALALQASPPGWARGSVEIDMHYRCSRNAVGYVAKDTANALAAMKAGIDGLIDAHVAIDDSKHYLTWGALSLLTTKSDRGDGVTLIIRAR